MAVIYLSDDFDTLETYFFSDTIGEANRLISEKVELAWDMISSSTAPYQTSVNSAGTKITREYATDAFANWQGSAMIVVNGSGLSIDESDQDYSFNSIEVILSEDGSIDPLAQVTLNLGLSVSGGRATSLTLDGFSIDAEGMHVGFDGPLTIDETLETASMPDARFEISYDSDPGADIVLSTIYIEGALSYNGETDTMTGTFSDFGFLNNVVEGEPTNYFYSTGLDASMDEFDALPEGSSSTDVLRALFEGTDDTVYTKTSLDGDTEDNVLPEGFENVVIEGNGDVDITGNTQDNVITGNVGNNVIDGGDGNDTFVTQGNFDQSNGVLNQDGSVSLTSYGGGTDSLINIENVQFDNGIKTINEVIGPLAPTSIVLDNLSVDENSPGAHIANISGIDPNNDDLTFSIVEGQSDAHMFTIMNNMLHLKTDVIADYEISRELEVILKATDQDDLFFEKLFTINIKDDKSNNTSNTEVTFSANLDDLGTFNGDPFFYFLVNGELKSWSNGTTLSDLAIKDQDDYIQFNPNDSNIEPPEVTYNPQSNIATFTYDMSPQNPGFYSEDYEIVIGMASFTEALAHINDPIGRGTFFSRALEYMGLNGYNEPWGTMTSSELQSWYEQNYVVRKLSEDGSWVELSNAEKPSWSELEQAFNERQSILSIDDNQMILNSKGTSNTEVTFSANLDDLGTFNGDPFFYFLVNGELKSWSNGTTLSDLAIKDQDDYIQFNPNDSNIEPPEVTYNPQSNIATFTYDMSPQNPGFYSEDYEIVIGMASFTEALAHINDPIGRGTFFSRALEYMGLNGYNEPWGTMTSSELQSWYEQNYVVRKLSEDGSWVELSNAEKPSWSELEQAFNERQSILSIDDNQMILNSKGTSNTEVTFSANLDDLGTFNGDPFFYFLVNGELKSWSNGTTLSDLAIKDQDDYIQFNPNDSNIEPPEVTYNPQSNIATFTYDMSPQNPGFYSEDYEIVIGMASFTEALAHINDPIGRGTFFSRALEYMGLNGYNEPWGTMTSSELQSWYEQNYVVRKLSEDGSWVELSNAEKPSWSELEQAFNERQSILSIDDNQMILNSIEITAAFTASIEKWGGVASSWLDGPVMKLHRKDILDEVGIYLSAKPDTPGHKHKSDVVEGTYELRVEHDQDTDGAINIDDVMGVLSLSRGITQTTSDEHKLAADWNGDGLINIDDVMGVLSRSRGMVKDDEWRFYDKVSDTSLWDKATKTNKMDIVLEEDKDIELSAILRGDVNGSYKAGQHDRPDPSPAPTYNPAPLPLNNDDDLLTINPDIV